MFSDQPQGFAPNGYPQNGQSPSGAPLNNQQPQQPYYQQQQYQGGGNNNYNNNGGGASSFLGGGGGGAQSMVLELGKQNLTSFVKQGEQGFLTTYVPFVRNLRHYFKVDNNYVRTKMQLLFFPFRHPKYIPNGSGVATSLASPLSAGTPLGGGVGAGFSIGDDFGGMGSGSNAPPYHARSGSNNTTIVAPPMSPLQGGGGDSGFEDSSPLSSGGGAVPRALPVDDLNAPDLYIPAMALVTYVALCAFIKGLQAEGLSPEYIASSFWSVFLWLVIEVAAVKIASMALALPIPLVVLDVSAVAGYKHVGICALVAIREILGLSGSSMLYWLLAVYYSAACVFLYARYANSLLSRKVSDVGGLTNMLASFGFKKFGGVEPSMGQRAPARAFPLVYGWAAVQVMFVFWFAMRPF